jgi:hypothetical protein
VVFDSSIGLRARYSSMRPKWLEIIINNCIRREEMVGNALLSTCGLSIFDVLMSLDANKETKGTVFRYNSSTYRASELRKSNSCLPLCGVAACRYFFAVSRSAASLSQTASRRTRQAGPCWALPRVKYSYIHRLLDFEVVRFTRKNRQKVYRLSIQRSGHQQGLID